MNTKTICGVIALILCMCSVAFCQFNNAYGGNYGYTGGSGSNYGLTGGNYNQYAQNTQAYSNQINAINYQPYASYGAYYRGPTSYGNNYGSAYSMPYLGGFGVPNFGGYYGGWGMPYRWC